jgi:hypothetical protein
MQAHRFQTVSLEKLRTLVGAVPTASGLRVVDLPCRHANVRTHFCHVPRTIVPNNLLNNKHQCNQNAA